MSITCPNTGCGYVAEGAEQKHCPRCGSFLPAPQPVDVVDPLIGQPIVGGKYRILSVLGEGGMGKVYLGEQKLGNAVRKVAIKTLQPDLAQDPQIVARFHRETETVILLEHPNTIKFYDFGELNDGKLFVAMEYIQGESLAHVIARGPMGPQKVEHILQQICGSLAEAHERGIVHRDLKPENIILTQKGARGDFVKVLDFGIAKRNEAEDAQTAKLTRQGMVLGTPPYMSPEQFTGQPLRPTSDIYSLAIMTYEMLTGRLPYAASTPWEWATKHLTGQPTPFESLPVTPQFNSQSVLPRHKASVMRGLSRNPADRPQTTTEFLQQFTGDANAGGDWAQSTNASPQNYNQGQPTPQPFNPQSQPFNPQSQPFNPQSQPGMQPGMQPGAYGQNAMGPTGMQHGVNYPPSGPQPMVNPTMAANFGGPGGPGFGGPGMGGYPSSNPGFGQPPSNPGFVPAPSNAGFQAVNVPPSNPGFNSNQGYPPGMGYGQPNMGMAPQGYPHPMPQQRPQGSGAGKVVAIVGVFLVLAIGVGVAATMKSGNTSTSTNTNTTVPVVANPPINTVQQPAVNNQLPQMPQQPNNVIQPIPPTNQVVMRPMDNPPPNFPPPNDPPQQVQQPQVQRPARPSVCSGGGSRIDDMILSGRCAAAQALFRQMRAAGCAGRAADSFGSACSLP